MVNISGEKSQEEIENTGAGQLFKIESGMTLFEKMTLEPEGGETLFSLNSLACSCPQASFLAFFCRECSALKSCAWLTALPPSVSTQK